MATAMPRMNVGTMGFRVALIVVAVLASALGFAEKVIVGKLGQAVKAATIRSKPSSGARAYYRVKPYEYLVLNAYNDRYHKVLLQNGRQGYIETSSVARLPYDVTVDKGSKSRPTLAASGSALGSGSARELAARSSLQYQGTPYKWGGNDPSAGIDCSAFVKYLYGNIGVNLPRTAAEQVKVGQVVARLEDLQPGDRLYFWSKKRGMIGHTGIYLGNGYFCHSSSSNGGVATDYLGESEWRNSLVAARR